MRFIIVDFKTGFTHYVFELHHGVIQYSVKLPTADWGLPTSECRLFFANNILVIPTHSDFQYFRVLKFKNQIVMKKTVVLLALVGLFSGQLMAQFSDAKLINAGVSFALYEKYYDDVLGELMDEKKSIPIHVQFERGLGDKLDLDGFEDYLTFGVYAGLQTKQRYYENYAVGDGYKEAYKKYTHVWGGVVGSLHAVELANKHLDFSIPSDQLDIYLSMRAGLVFQMIKKNYENNPQEVMTQMNNFVAKDDKTFVFFAPVVGARYFLTEKAGLFLEIGKANLSLVSLGATVKL